MVQLAPVRQRARHEHGPVTGHRELRERQVLGALQDNPLPAVIAIKPADSQADAEAAALSEFNPSWNHCDILAAKSPSSGLILVAAAKSFFAFSSLPNIA